MGSFTNSDLTDSGTNWDLILVRWRWLFREVPL